METKTPRQEPSFVEKRPGDTLPNAVIGGIAGYLQNEGKTAGAKVGATSGALAAIPAFLFVSIVIGSIGVVGVGAGELGLGALFGGVAIVFLVFVLAIAAGLSALGGYVGGAIAERGDEPRRRGGDATGHWSGEEHDDGY